MFTFITRDEMRRILDEAPEGVSSRDIVLGLRRKGHTLEGFKAQIEPVRQRPQLIDKAKGVGVGILKGVGSTLFGITKIAERASRVLLPKALEPDIGEKPRFLKPRTKEEKIGFAAEQIGEFLIPLGGSAKALALAGKVALKSGRLANFGIKAVGESGEFAMKAAAQTGGEFDSTAKAFALGIGINAALGTVGVVGRSVAEFIPERVFSIIFKTTADDLAAAYRTVAKGKELNPTLAREALDRGLRGSSEKMAITAVKNLDDLEAQMKPISDLGLTKLNLKGLGSKENYLTILKRLEDKFTEDFVTKSATRARSLIRLLERETQQIPTNLAIAIKRFVDGARNKSSFALNPKLAGFQEGLKEAADKMRGLIQKTNPKITNLLGEERVMIQAFSSIVKNAAQAGNRNVIGLTDILAGGGGTISGGVGQGITAAVAIRAFQQPFTLTNLGFFIDRAKKLGLKATPQEVRQAFKGLVVGGAQQTGLPLIGRQ